MAIWVFLDVIENWLQKLLSKRQQDRPKDIHSKDFQFSLRY